MSGEVSTIQSLKAVDAWIDVINANINGGVRTAFKSSRLKFSGSNTNVDRPGNATSLPLQFPEPSLTAANTVIDFTQGAITASTENTHLAIQGEGYFLIASPDMIDTNPASATFGATKSSPTAKLLLTRDGEFHTNAQGLLVNANGYYLVTTHYDSTPGKMVLNYNTGGAFGLGTGIRAVYDNMDQSPPTTGVFVRLTDFITNCTPTTSVIRDNQGNSIGVWATSLIEVPRGEQNLRYSTYGSTVFDFGFQVGATNLATQIPPQIDIYWSTPADATILSKSLESSNSSMTQSVPELSLAQKLFSALTKVLQTKQTNVDGVLNLVR